MSSEYNQIQSFPKNLSFNLAKINGSLIRQRIRVDADKSSYNGQEIIRINLPVGRMIDMRSVCLYAKATTTGTGTTVCHPHLPRGGLNSLIEQLQITCNGRILQSTSQYNYIWNILADVSGYYSQEQAAKRITELFDPSIRATNLVGEANPVITNTINDVSADVYNLAVNQWLGFFSQNSCSTLNTNDLGTVQVSITLAPNSCLWYGKTQGNSTDSTANSYKLEEVRLAMDCITFTNSTYFELVKTQLEGEGLNIAYYEYTPLIGNSVAKSTGGITFSGQINCSSLDQVIATFRPTTYDTPTKLYLANGITQTGAVNLTDTNFNKVLADLETNSDGFTFNNSVYYVRDGGGYDGSSFFINSQPFTQNASPVECINGVLQAMNYTNLDVGSGSFHPGVVSTGHFFNHYFCDILSLENESADGSFWISGLSSQGGTINISYNCRFKTRTNTVYPYLICRTTKTLNIKIGRMLDLLE